MPDYDVGAAGLASPPSSAVLTTYRPSILVRNFGIHARTATGYVRIYKAGSLVFESNVYSGTIQPGATGLALAERYWVPTTVGSYFAQGLVTCELDQVAANNPLAPTPFVISSEPPPPPPIVTPHASQHEDGGDDEMTVDGLPGKLRERQDPYSHASDHQQGGSDQLNVGGLPGQLAEEQKPAGHGNEAHSPSFATNAAVGEFIGVHNGQVGAHPTAIAHGIDVHNADTQAHGGGLEHVINKDTGNGYAGLDVFGRIAAERLPTGIELQNNKDQENGYAGLDGDKMLNPDQIPSGPSTGFQKLNEKDQASGYAGLDGDGQLDADELPEGIERTANKGVEDGYCPLNADALVEVDRIVHSDEPAPVATCIYDPQLGQEMYFARLDHSHRATTKSANQFAFENTIASSVGSWLVATWGFDTHGISAPHMEPPLALHSHIAIESRASFTAHMVMVQHTNHSTIELLRQQIYLPDNHGRVHTWDLNWRVAEYLHSSLVTNATLVYRTAPNLGGVVDLHRMGSEVHLHECQDGIFGYSIIIEIPVGDSLLNFCAHHVFEHDVLGIGPSILPGS